MIAPRLVQPGALEELKRVGEHARFGRCPMLRRCAEAAGPDGRVLLGELVTTSDEDRRAFTYMDLRMLVYLGGRERALEEFTALTGAAGLAITAVIPAKQGNSLIECTIV